jgi:hypothetical protein
MAPKANKANFVVSGTVEETETGRPLANLIVRAFDKDLLFDDRLGYTTTDADGRFVIRYGPEQFKDLFENAPDLYLRIFDRDGIRMLLETIDAVRTDASTNEEFRIKIPASRHDPNDGIS